jgi:hypothetical protein
MIIVVEGDKEGEKMIGIPADLPFHPGRLDAIASIA